jgi:hypothetical protein
MKWRGALSNPRRSILSISNEMERSHLVQKVGYNCQNYLHLLKK